MRSAKLALVYLQCDGGNYKLDYVNELSWDEIETLEACTLPNCMTWVSSCESCPTGKPSGRSPFMSKQSSTGAGLAGDEG